MSAEAVGRFMPFMVTLDDLTAMMAADERHRYEISPEGVLSIMPPPGYAHAIIATRLMVWLAAAGVPADRIAQAVGLRIHGRDGGVGGRIPDLVVWSRAQVDGVWLPGSSTPARPSMTSADGVDAGIRGPERSGAHVPDRSLSPVSRHEPVQTRHSATGGGNPMDMMTIAETFASFPGAIFDLMSTLPPVVWASVIFMPLAVMLLRILDA